MRSPSRVVLPVAGLVAAAIGGCVASPTAPDVQLKPGLFLDGEPIPCDSTIITDGTCRGGYIIQYDLQPGR
jgi:hypothetical protein